jgi:DNA-binding response OmpR family regulator
MSPVNFRILCVDEYGYTCEMLNAILGSRGYEAKVARDFSEAVRCINTEEFDLYVIENPLPDGAGLQFCKFLRGSFPGSTVIFYPINPFEPTCSEALEADADSWIPNNGNIFQLAEAILRSSRK